MVIQHNINRKKLGALGILVGVTAATGAVLTSAQVSADPATRTASDNVTVQVAAACTLSGGGNTYTGTMIPGTTDEYGPSTIKAVCNDASGHSLYVIGYSNDLYGNTQMIYSAGGDYAINTGTSGSDSYWAMKLSPVAGTYAPTIVNSFDSYHVVPEQYTQAATYNSATDAGESATGSNVQATYTVHIGTGQVAGTYTGKVKYTLVHPNNAPAPTPGTLWDAIAAMSKGTQTSLAELQAEITTPTSSDPSEDTSNSGVYEYNSALFGAASDASNAWPIYYYRGILDTADGKGSYGSDGQADAYPNYVKLANNTCWRIVRTTGSGGIKMIYNGTYGATTANSCANSTTNAQLTTSAYNSGTGVAVTGYTYNSNYTTNASTNGVATDTVLGSNNDMSVNDTRSTIKTYIEDTWYAANMTAYTSKLEANAGYCNDRSYYGTDTTATSVEDIVTPISSSGNNYFGGYNRNMTNDSTGPSLHCTRGEVDIYRYISGSTGVANELKYPAALLTADEMALAGSGPSDGNPTTYSANSFLRSGSDFWSLSPDYRNSRGNGYVFSLHSVGYINGSSVAGTSGVRPAISLAPGTDIVAGTGTATDPWTIESD